MHSQLFRLLLLLSVCGAIPLAQAEALTSRDTPHLAGTNSDTCLLGGQRLRLTGERLGSERLYQLLLLTGGQQQVLRVEQWREQAITAVLPTDLLPAAQPAMLMIKNRQSLALVSNRLPISLCAEPQQASRLVESQVSTAPQPVIESTALAAPTEPGTQPTPPPPLPRQLTTSNGVFVADNTPPPQGAADDDAGVEPGELIVFSQDMASARQMDEQISPWGYRIKRRRALQRLGLVITVIRLPDQTRVEKAIRDLQQIDARLIMDANHQYRLMQAGAGNTNNADNNTGTAAAQRLLHWDRPDPACGRDLRIGMVDTLVDANHATLSGAKIVSRSFLPLGVKAADSRHATAIASLLVGQPGQVNDMAGLVPAAGLYNAGIFREAQEHQADTTAELIITALDWLQGQQVNVINLSLAGKANRLLQAAIQQLVKQGQLIAAAAGNAGPQAPPAYPAAWPGVVAVTAVDLGRNVYRQANQGSYIDLAAPGVDVWAARAGAEGAYYSGTSYAVPYVSAALAVLRQRDAGQSSAQLLTRLQRQASDLGAPGPDPVFGHGLLQLRGACG